MKEVAPGALGTLAIKLPLPPGSMLTLYNNDKRYLSSYMEAIPGFYDTGDAGIIDTDGYVHVMSRTDDVINVAGHRLSCGAMEEVDHPPAYSIILFFTHPYLPPPFLEQDTNEFFPFSFFVRSLPTTPILLRWQLLVSETTSRATFP